MSETPGSERKRLSLEKIFFEEITPKNFSNLMKRYQPTEPGKFTNVKQDKHKTTSRIILVKSLKIKVKTKEKNLKRTQIKRHTLHTGHQINIITDF